MIKSVSIDKLMINPSNYRFDPVDNQTDAIVLMMEEKGDEILALAKHIKKHGLDAGKNIRVLEIKPGLYVVLDGNRRMTAIKCLADPTLIKDTGLQKKFIELLKTDGQFPLNVSCIVYSSEEEASEWIRLDHTGKNNGIGQDPWEVAGKERFDYKFAGKLSPATQTLNFYKLESNGAFDPKDLKISTLNRILSNPESRSYLGVDVKNSKLLLTSKKKEVVNRLDKLFNKLIIDDVPVRDVYHTHDSIKFMRELFSDKPKSASSITEVTMKGRVKKQKQKSLPKSAARNTLIPSDCILRITAPKINNIYHELRTIQLDVGTNAVSVLFRVFMETSLDHFASNDGFPFKTGTKLAGKITKVAEFLEKKEVASSKQLSNIRKVPTRGNSILSIDNFHEYVHSFTAQPAPIDLIFKWDNLQEFFEILFGYLETKNLKPKRKA